MEQLHSHDWKVEAHFVGRSLDKHGVLIDSGAAQDALRRVLAELDGRDLTDARELDGTNPSAENLACWVFARLRDRLKGRAELARVRVWESPGFAAAYQETQE